MRTTFLLLLVCFATGCNQQKSQTLEEKNPEEESARQVIAGDTTVYDMPYHTAYLGNEYFRENTRYKDWDKNNRQAILVRAIIEKDSTASNIVILSKNVAYPELGEEVIRLIQEAKIHPALNENGEVVRSKWTNVVYFPPK